MVSEMPQLSRIVQAVRTGMVGRRALVVGDLMLDKYLWGEVTRISPEAPVPVLRHGRDAAHAGGAGNVAANLAGLGLQTTVAGFIAADEAGVQLRALFDQAGIDTSGIVTLDDRPTITKTRIIGGHQHVLRIDVEDLRPVQTQDTQRLLEGVLRQLAGVDCVVLSDYGKGVLTPHTCSALIGAARQRGIPVFVDPKGLDYTRYRGATLLTPNLRELAAAGRVADASIDRLIDAARRFVAELDLDALALTRGADGMTLIERDRTIDSRAIAREVFDVSGAGDTVIATLAAGHLAGLTGIDLLHLANVAAGIVVGKIGTVAVQRSWVLEALQARNPTPLDSVHTLGELQVLVADWRARGERIAFTNGCFDILHAGHVACLHRAAQEGDRLIVALNSDHSVRALKGPSRPVNSQQDRAVVIAALAAVDAVICFDEPTPLALINALHPDVLVKGGDYGEAQIVGAREVQSWGGRVVIVPLVPGHSTSTLISQLQSQLTSRAQ